MRDDAAASRPDQPGPTLDRAQLLATFPRPRSGSPVRVAVLADLHLSVEETGTWRVSHRTEQRLREAVASINALDPDAVLFAGDLTGWAAPEEYDAVDRAIADLDAPLFAVPGNHDFPLEHHAQEGISIAAFEQRYAPGGFPWRERVGDVDVLGLNSNRATSDAPAERFEGRIDGATLDWLHETLPGLDDPLVTVHHSLPGVRAFYERARDRLPTAGDSPILENADELAAVLVEHGVPLVLTGHLHVPAVVAVDDVHELSLPPLGPFPHAYTVLDVHREGTDAYVQFVGDRWERMAAIGYGMEKDRVLLAASQLADTPLAPIDYEQLVE